MSKVESIFGSSSRGRYGCGYLSRREIDHLLAGELDEARSVRFDEHRRACDACLLLGVAVERFRDVIDDGVLEVEARQFAAGEATLKDRLREEFEREFGDSGRGRISLPWGREMSADELESIAAAGTDRPADPPAPQDDDESPGER